MDSFPELSLPGAVLQSLFLSGRGQADQVAGAPGKKYPQDFNPGSRHCL